MPPLLSDFSTLDPTTRWMLVVVGGLTILYAVMRPMRRRKDPLSRQNPGATLANQRSVERDMNNLLVELSEMARQVTAQLDTRTLKLEMLLKQADERIAALKQAAANAPATNGEASADISPAKPAEPPAPVIDPRHLEVYELSDQNLGTQDIANRLNRPRGEVELILKLRHKSVG